MSIDKHRNPDGTYNGVGVMSELSGIPRHEVLSIWEQVKANQYKLSACPWHDFEPILPLVKTGQKYRCKHCGGEVNASAYHWHEQGRRARPTQDTCKRCGGPMAPGQAIAQTYTGLPDFPGDEHAVTVSPGGPGKLVDVLKCSACGWSVTP